jgi:hypothetical protein
MPKFKEGDLIRFTSREYQWALGKLGYVAGGPSEDGLWGLMFFDPSPNKAEAQWFYERRFELVDPDTLTDEECVLVAKHALGARPMEVTDDP